MRQASMQPACFRLLAAHCLVAVGEYEQATVHARDAERLYREIGDSVGAARAAHATARSRAASGDFDSVRGDFERCAEVVFRANLFDVWSIMRLDYVAAALAHDEGADVRAELKAIARYAPREFPM